MRLLLRAIRSLPQADQDAVLALLLGGLAGDSAWDFAVRQSDERRRGEIALRGTMDLTIGGMLASERDMLATPDVKMVPIRFPAKLYEELKAWCVRHGFPMAAVVRGLVERFLESQGRP